MMSSTVAGIDPHQDTFAVAMIDINGVENTHDTFANTSSGYLAAIELLSAHDVGASASRARRAGGRTCDRGWPQPVRCS